MKKVMDYSIQGMKKFGNFMKKGGIKGFGHTGDIYSNIGGIA